MRTQVKRAQKMAKLHIKQHGDPVTLRWTNWPNGKPALDETTGSVIPDQAKPSETLELTVRAKTHEIAPAMGGIRQNAEVKIGNMIIDFVIAIMRITNIGDTDLNAGDVVDEFAFLAANRALSPMQRPAESELVSLKDLENIMFMVNGTRYVPAEVGDKLVEAWDATYAGVKVSQSILLERGK